ncbi:MAG: GAF domain-containing protein, partial [Deltaproteobacteria bacterium]
MGSALAAMAALRSLLNPTAFTLFLAAVTVTALYAGTGPAVLAAALSVFGSYLLLASRISGEDAIRLGLFAMTAVLIIWVAAARRRAEDERRRLLWREQEARARAETAAGLLRRVQSIVDVALGRFALDDMMRELLERIRGVLGVERAVVLLLDEEENVLVVRAAKGFESEVEQRVRVPIGSGLAGRVAAERRSIAMADIERDEAISHHPIEAGIRSLLDVPLVVGGRVIGVISIGSKSRRVFATTEIELLELAAERIAVAIDGARAYEAEQRARAAAEAANRAKDEFFAMLSHELRTPLGAILSWAHLLRSGRLDAAGTGRAVQTIDRNARLQAQLINDLLDVSRITAGKLELDLRVVDPASVVEAALSAVRPEADAAGLVVDAAIDHSLGALRADPDRLQQVMSNLLSNAIKFTPRGGRIEVRLERAGSQATIAVNDTGPGVAADLLPHVFERFRQGEGPATRRHGGLGLGLTIVRHLVELHGGTVEVESPGELGGATFIVRLPLLPSEAAAGGPEIQRLAPLPGGPPRADGLHVLLVDDDANTL